MIQLNTGLNCDFTHGKHLLRVMRHSFDSPTLIMTSNSPPAPGYFFRQENDLKWSVRSAWETYTGHCVAWALLSLHVFVFACVCACLSVDSGALMLKDVSSFLQCTGLLQQPCWAALMSRMCHCRTFSSEITARGDQNGMFILSIPPPLSTSVSLSFCLSFSWLLVLSTLETLTFNSCTEMSPDWKKLQLYSGGALLLDLKVWQSYHSTSFYVFFLLPCMAPLDWL